MTVALSGCVGTRNFHVNEGPSSSSRSREGALEKCLIVAPSTTGKLATVRDMQSSTSAEMITGMPPRVMIYDACTRDTMVVTTDKMKS